MSPRIELVTPRLILVAVTLDLIEAEIYLPGGRSPVPPSS
jgi:hypothetical protein